MRFPPSFLDEMRSRLRVSEVVGRRVKLKRSGNGEMIGLCPFHHEKSPSFSVSDRKGFYHCFGCGAHGDLITFTMETEGKGFAEAVADLASQAGLMLPKQDKEEEERYRRMGTLYDVTEAACAWFEMQLTSPAGKQARDYFMRRGITEETIRHFRLGYAPESRDALKSALLAQGISERQLVEAGLLVDKGAGSKEQGAEDTPAPSSLLLAPCYDRFRARVIFPIMDSKGKVIAFGGRILGEGQPKYLNSPETELFHKGHVLYAFHLARERAHKKNAIVAVEGYMDVIALHQAGITNAVAPLGTALTEHHLKLLWSVAPEPVICLDGDTAGQRAMLRAATLALPFLEPALSLKFAILPGGEDPDDFLRSHGAKALRELLAGATPLADTLWEMTLAQHTLGTPEQKAAFEAALMDYAGAIKNTSVQQYYKQYYRDKLWKMRQTRGKWGKDKQEITASGGRPLKSANAQLSPKREHIEISLIAAAMHHPELLRDHATEEAFAHLEFATKELDALRHALLEICASSPEISAAEMLLALENHAAVPHMNKVRKNPYLDSFTRPEAAPECVRSGWNYMLASYHLVLTEEEYQALAERFSEDTAAQSTALREQVEMQKKLVEKEKVAYEAALGD